MASSTKRNTMERNTSLWACKRIYVMSWDRFESLVSQISRAMSSSGFSPDMIVGIARGGLVPAVRLMHELSLLEFGIIHIRRNTGPGCFSARVSPKLCWEQVPTETSRSILLVDDIAGTGDTLNTALASLAPSPSTQIRTATLVLNRHANFHPDYYGLLIDDWVLFPWESRDAAETEAKSRNIPIVEL